jgi:regulation of enolase protein 1 (concanavalin A-like superfamily)
MNETHFPPAGTVVAWSDGFWRNQPSSVSGTPAGGLLAEAVKGSDAWQHTSYGFVRDSEHGLLHPFAPGTAVEVDFVAFMTEQFAQAGLIVRVNSGCWVKAGTEFSDGTLRLSVVATNTCSDWSTAPVPHWSGKTATIRASLSDGALILRAKADTEPFELVRVVPFITDRPEPIQAGPYLCAPSRSGFQAEFIGWRTGAGDPSLH